MFFAWWIYYHHEGIFLSLVHIHVWWWRRSGLVWVLTWIPRLSSQGRRLFWWTDQPSACIHTWRTSNQWLCNLPVDNVHSLENLCDLIEDNFYHFYIKHIDQKLLQQQNTPHESPMDFWQCFRHLQFQAPKSQMKFPYLWDRFEYYLNKSVHPKNTFKLKPHLAHFDDGSV